MPANAAADEKVAEAIAFKNRLVRVFITNTQSRLLLRLQRGALLRVRRKK